METNEASETPPAPPPANDPAPWPEPSGAIVTCGVSAGGAICLLVASENAPDVVALRFEMTDEMADMLHAQLSAIRRTRAVREGEATQRTTRAMAVSLVQQAAEWLRELQDRSRKEAGDFDARMDAISKETLERIRGTGPAGVPASPPPAG